MYQNSGQIAQIDLQGGLISDSALVVVRSDFAALLEEHPTLCEAIH